MTTKIAVIDMGTNTFHLLLAEKVGDNLSVLYNEKVPVKIGQGGINDGVIIEEAQERAIKTLEYFKGIIDKYEIRNIYATATSAIRSAKNGRELCKKIEDNTGISVRIISGELEAQYIYGAVKKAVKLGDEKSLIMDIGGGSVEFIICDQEQIFWKASYEIGAQRLLDLFHYHDPIITEEIENLNLYLTEKLTDLVMACIEFKPTTLIGSSGSFDTFSDIYSLYKGMSITDRGTELPLSIQSFKNIYQTIITKSKAERLEIPGMVEMRVDMIVVASILVDYVIKNCHVSNIRVSSYSLKEGVLFNILENLNVS